MASFIWSATHRARGLRREAARFAANGWPVSRLAVRRGGRCTCPLRDCTDPHLTLRPPVLISRARDAERHWGDIGWAIALVTQTFDVLRLPAAHGAHLHQVLGSSCPTAIARSTRGWQFFITPGGIDPAEVAHAGGEVISGPSRWIPAPGTDCEDVDPYRWIVQPHLAKWQPCGDIEAIEAVLRTTDWTAADAPFRRPPDIVDRALH